MSLPHAEVKCKSPRKFVIPGCLSGKGRKFQSAFEVLWETADDEGELTLNVEEVCRKCECSRQTLYRIIRYLNNRIIRRRGWNLPILERVEHRTGRGNHSLYRLNWKSVAPRVEKTVTPFNLYREKEHQRRCKSDRSQGALKKAPNDEVIIERLHLSETLPERKARNCLAMCVRWKAWQMRWTRTWQQALTQSFTKYTQNQPLWRARELAWELFHNLCADWSRNLKRWLGWLRSNYSLSESVKALHAYLRNLFKDLVGEPQTDPDIEPVEVLRMALRDLLGREPTKDEVRERMAC